MAVTTANVKKVFLRMVDAFLEKIEIEVAGP
jgi:hypothetical protein